MRNVRVIMSELAADTVRPVLASGKGPYSDIRYGAQLVASRLSMAPYPLGDPVASWTDDVDCLDVACFQSCGDLVEKYCAVHNHRMS